MFWFYKKQQKKVSYWPVIFFTGVLAVIFLILNGIYALQSLSKSSVEQQSFVAQKLAWWVDKQVGNFFGSAGRIYQAVQSWEAVLNYTDDINTIFDTLQNNQTLKDNIPSSYQKLYNFWLQWLPYKNDILNLLWSDRVHTYLIALMNSAEIRPNWGFFWSYAIVQIQKGKVIKNQIYDSYYAYYQNTGAQILLDKNYQKILGQENINFISPNVYGFTAQDGGNIKNIYEQLFPGQNIDGVIMLRSEVLQKLVPELKNKFIEWQFVNASIDLIRGNSTPNKKEKYLTDMGTFLNENKSTLLTQIINNLPTLFQNHDIQLYFPQSTQQFQSFLADQWLMTVHDKENLYVWNLNKSFNKIDSFVVKRFALQDKNGQVVAESENGIFDPQEIKKALDNGSTYDLYFYYTLSIPQSYNDQIFWLTKQYDIVLTPREQHILGLSYNWRNQAIVNLPENLEFVALEGSYYNKNNTVTGSKSPIPSYQVIDGPENQIVTFDVMWFTNNALSVVRMKVKKK